VLIDIVI